MKTTLITLAAIVGVCIIGFFMTMSSKNSAISLEETVQTASSDIEVQLSNRFQKLHELAACVKKYDEHEYKTLVGVIEARGKNMSAKDAKNCIAAFSRLEERYPELKSVSNYNKLMNDIALTENILSQKKDAYNKSVKDYKYHCRKFPTSLFLSITGYEVVQFEYYSTTDEVKDSDNHALKLFD